MNEAVEVPYSAGSAAPRVAVPMGACDCHMHIYDQRFLPSPHWKQVPPVAPVATYRQLQRRLGTTRTVIVQPSTYGIDNRCTLDALNAMGSDARAVVVLDTDVAPGTLRQLHAQGVRGVRVNFVSAQSWGVTTVERLHEMARLIAPVGWHVQIFATADQIAAMEASLDALPVPLVIDHLGRVPQPDALGHPGYAAVRRLLDNGRTWLKLSGAYMNTLAGAPGYDDVSVVAKSFVAAAPERMVWGTDWPHPTAAIKPDDAVLLDLLLQWAPDASTRERILVTNPGQLYDFPELKEATK